MADDVQRARSGVRKEVPTMRWDPGARYRPSLLAGRRTPPEPARLRGRLFRGPARRAAVFDRAVWDPREPLLSPRAAAQVADAVERYRRGDLRTTGLGRAVGHALAG
ncbi:MAG: hypothetical protein FWF90_08855 [Promicromonosporaceae bacterium]|nr:hypothetical protein [Promicromonosporaceae bacterium]